MLFKIATEYQECRTFFSWSQYNPRIKGFLIKHVNEGKRSRLLGRLLKLIGLTPGLPDYQLLLSNKNWNGLFIEMKTVDEKGKKQPINQVNFIKKLISKGYYATFAFGADEAIKITENYLNDKI